MMNNESIILEPFHGARICDIVLDIEHREYVEIRTDKGTFYISIEDNRIDYGVSP